MKPLRILERTGSAEPPPAASGMVRIDGGTFRMGSDRHYPEEAPVHRVTVDGFWIDRTPVTNREFRRFVEGDRPRHVRRDRARRPRTIPARSRTC